MCRQCQTKPVYGFTNGRKLCKNCFIRWFEKKALFSIRKFNMIKRGDIVSYERKNDFRSVVLEKVLELVAEKGFVNIIKLSSLHSEINKKLLNKNLFVNEIKCKEPCLKAGSEQHKSASEQSEREKLKINKLAVPITTDLTAYEIVNELINGDIKNLNKFFPVYKKIINPLYLFLDEEVFLYAELKRLKYKKLGSLQSRSRFIAQFQTSSRNFAKENLLRRKKFKDIKKSLNGIKEFVDKLELKHPEIKRAIVNGVLKMNA